MTQDNHPNHRTPEDVQEKMKATMRQMRENPGLSNMLRTMGVLAKSALENGIGLSQMNSEDAAEFKKVIKQHLGKNQSETPQDQAITTPPEVSDTPNSFADAQFVRPTNRNAPTPSSTYNPVSKGDHLRMTIFIAAVIVIIGYLIYKSGLIS